MYTLDDFYRSSEWGDLLKHEKIKRINKSGELICEYCGKPIVKKYDCIGHHKEELTEDNVNDYNVSLNPDNVSLVHHKCHNIIHNKLQHSRRSVYIVYGSPLSGKTTYVNQIRNDGDLIIDIDSIWECISGCDRYIKPNRLKSVVFGMRDYLFDCIKYRRGKWTNAYIVGGYPLISERERLAKELGAELIFINTPKEECISRLFSVSETDNRDYVEWSGYIDEWWDRYTPTLT